MRGISKYSALGAALKEGSSSNSEGEETLRHIGQMLRDAREAFGITVKQAASDIVISDIYVQSLENGDWSTMPGEVYGRGYLKKYAEYLGFERSDIMSRLSPAPKAADIIATPILRSRHRRINLRPVLLGVIVIAIAFLFGMIIAKMPYAKGINPVKPIPSHFSHYIEFNDMTPFYRHSCLAHVTPDNMWGCYFSRELDIAEHNAHLVSIVGENGS